MSSTPRHLDVNSGAMPLVVDDARLIAWIAARRDRDRADLPTQPPPTWHPGQPLPPPE